MKTIPILFTFDDSLILPAGVCISSLLRSAAAETFYDIFILYSEKYDLENSDLNRLTETYGNCRLNFRKVGAEFVGAYEIRGIPETAYYRLISPEIITEYDKIIYSDVDVIFRSDLAKYYELDLGTNCFAAVDNCSALRPDVQLEVRDRLGLDWRNGYYYSGNLVINLRQIREEGLCDKFRELGHNDYNQQDMDIMNIACNGRFLPLGPAFCLTNYLYDLAVKRRADMDAIYGHDAVEEALRSGIIHYNGAKPWNGWCHHADIWWECYRCSPFFDEAFYNDFYNQKSTELERLPLIKRLKLLARYFIR